MDRVAGDVWLTVHVLSYVFILQEQYNGMLVYDVSAKDQDFGKNGIVDYSFIYNGEDTQNTPEFNINRVTGVISAEIVYDRERVNRYVVGIHSWRSKQQDGHILSFSSHYVYMTSYTALYVGYQLKNGIIMKLKYYPIPNCKKVRMTKF